MIKNKKDRFPKTIDPNEDNKINLTEFANWNLPSINESIKHDINSILKTTDANKDGFISKSELMKKIEMFNRFEFTNFGEDYQSLHPSVSSVHEEL